ncbi:hypothetical protein J6590_066284 [Homalodisca vitripennis]|nr:hypothetical protein J6590_066284 [Homalodisca vitripennis]
MCLHGERKCVVNITLPSRRERKCLNHDLRVHAKKMCRESRLCQFIGKMSRESHSASQSGKCVNNRHSRCGKKNPKTLLSKFTKKQHTQHPKFRTLPARSPERKCI